MLLCGLASSGDEKSGSHERWVHRDRRTATIPIHGGSEIGPPFFHKILAQPGVSVDEFCNLR